MPPGSGCDKGPDRRPHCGTCRRALDVHRHQHRPGRNRQCGSLFEFDLQNGQAIEILRLPSALLAYDWSPDGTLLAYQVQGRSSPETMPVSLCLFDTPAGTIRLLQSLPEWIGRGGNQRDEVSVAWSPDADQILAVDTIGYPTIFVVDLDGRDIVTPQRGTFARWLSNQRVLFQMDHQNTQPWEWVSMATATGRARPFDLPPAAYRPALSPNGSPVAFDNGDRPSIYVFDRDRGTTRRLARGAVSPVWLGSGSLAATVAVPCPPTYFCTIPWISTDEAIGIDVATGESRPLGLGTTLQRSIGALDVVLAGD